jgi:hypothetical protein
MRLSSAIHHIWLRIFQICEFRGAIHAGTASNIQTFSRWSQNGPERNAMRKTLLALSAAVAVMAAMPLISSTNAAAQVGVDVEVGPRSGIHVGPRYRPHCRTVTVSEWRHGVRVTRTERRCDRDY